MNDIQTQDDIYLIVSSFYDKLLADERINFFFTEVVKIKLQEHLPILVSFWSQSLLGTGGYFNNLTQIHLDINKKYAITSEHFTIWLEHFEISINENFAGINCESMKTQANNLATIMQIKMKKEQL